MTAIAPPSGPASSGLREALAGLPRDRLADVLQGLSAEQLQALLYDWEHVWSRPEQRLPGGDDWDFWLIQSGRGWGKSRCGAEAVRKIVRENPGIRVAIVCRTSADTRDVAVEGESGIMAVHPPSERPLYEPSKRRLTWRNGSQATVYSAEEGDALRGPQHAFAWLDELATWSDVDAAWNNLLLGLRLGSHPRVVITTTPRPLRLLRDLVKHPRCIVTRGSTWDNARNLPETALREFRERFGETGRLARQEILGELLDDAENAMFVREWFAIVGEAPADAKWLRYWDLAATPDEAGKDPDWTVGAKVGLKDGVWYVGDVVRLRGTPMMVEAAVRSTAEADGRIPVVMEQEPGSSGVSMIDHYRRHVLVGVDFRADKKTGNKVELAGPFSAAAQAGNVRLVRGKWNAAFLDEVAEFPLGEHDDQVDAASGAMRFLREAVPWGGLIEWYQEQAALLGVKGGA